MRPNPQAVVVTLACSLILLSGAATFVDPDCWHLMSLAREALVLGHLPLEDRFAYTPTVFPVVQHEWGSGMLLYALATNGGVAAFQITRLVLVCLLIAGAVSVARHRGATMPVLAILALPAIVMSWIALTAIRPQLLTLVFLALWLRLIEADRDGRWWWIPVALSGQIVWQNLHGGFVVGWGLVALHTLEQAARGRRFAHLLAVLGVLALVVVINPYRTAYYPYLAHALAMPRPLIAEWRPIWEASKTGLAIYVASLVVAAGATAAIGLRRAEGWSLLAVSAYLAARHERHVCIYALVWFAYVPAFASQTRVAEGLVRRIRASSGLVTWVATATLLVAGLALFAAQRPWRLTVPGTTRDWAPQPYPVGPVAYLAEQGLTANVFVPFVGGAFVSWKLHPSIKVSLDGRYEVAYPPALLEDHLDFYAAAPRWRAILDAYPTDLVLVRTTAPVRAFLATQSPWTVVYRDDAYELFARPGLRLPLRDRRGEQLLGSLP